MALSKTELKALSKACEELDEGYDYRSDDYIYNVLNTALDFQMKSEVVNASISYFTTNHKVKKHKELKIIIDAYPNTNEGNRELANFLWNNNHWTRAKFLREIISCFDARGIRGQKSLAKWVENADFETDVKGQFRTEEHSIGYTLFHWLNLRVGVDTVKPDVHVLNFIKSVINRPVSPKEAVEALTGIAKDLNRKAYRLDAAIWHKQHDTTK